MLRCERLASRELARGQGLRKRGRRVMVRRREKRKCWRQRVVKALPIMEEEEEDVLKSPLIVNLQDRYARALTFQKYFFAEDGGRQGEPSARVGAGEAGGRGGGAGGKFEYLLSLPLWSASMERHC
jgi:hypothetical protein